MKQLSQFCTSEIEGDFSSMGMPALRATSRTTFLTVPASTRSSGAVTNVP